MRYAAASVGGRDRLMDDRRRLRRRGNGFGVEADIAEEQIRLSHLDIIDTAQLGRHVPGKGKHGGMVAGCFIKAGDKMCAAGTGCARANTKAPSKLRLSRGGKRSSLLMSYADPFNLAAANRVAQRVEGIADQAEDLPNPDLFEHTD